MGKYSRCVIDICDNGMQYLELHKNHSNMDRDIIMHKLLTQYRKGGKQLIQESLHTFVTTSMLG